MVLSEMKYFETRVEVIGTSKILKKEEMKSGNMIPVITALASEVDFKTHPLVKMEAESLKDITINPLNFEGTVRKKIFSGLNIDGHLGTVEEVSQNKQKLSEFMHEFQNLEQMNEDIFLDKIHNIQNGFQFSYIEDIENVNSIINTENSDMKWLEDLEKECGITGSHSGINQPWMYISGDPGSLFALHSEDSNLRSINFHLAGAPKVWYALPYNEISKLEKLVQKYPEGCPVWHRHKDHWVDMSFVRKYCEIPKIWKAVQLPGDIIITSGPHQGFNKGMNVNIAINFHTGPKDIELTREPAHCPPTKEHCRYDQKSIILNDVTNNLIYKIQCPQCEREFDSRNGVKYHLKAAHKMTPQQSGLIESQCPICDKRFSQLDLHIQNTHNLPSVYCMLCRNQHRNKSELNKHWTTAHNTKENRKCKSCTFVAQEFLDVYEYHHCVNEEVQMEI